MNKLYRDKSFDINVDQKICKLLIKMLLVWTIPILITIVLPLFIFDINKVKESGSIENIVYSIIIIFGLIYNSYYIYKFNRDNIYMLGNKSLYFLYDGKLLYYTRQFSNKMGNYIKKNIKLTEKIKYTPSVIVYSIFFIFSTFGISKISFMKQQLYFKMNLKKHFCEDLLMSDEYKNYVDQIYSISRIKEFKKGIEVEAVVLNNGNESRKKFIIYNTIENYEKLKDILYKMKEEELKNGYTLDNEMINVLNKVLKRKLVLFIIFMLLILLIIIIRICSYYYDIRYNFIVMRYLGYINLNKAKLISGILLILIFSIFGRNIYDYFKKEQFTYVEIDNVEYLNIKKNILGILYDFKKYGLIKYNNKTIQVGIYGDIKDKSYLILRNNIPYCIISK